LSQKFGSERICEAEILHARGGSTIEQDSSQAEYAEYAEEFLRRAIEVSKAQKAKGGNCGLVARAGNGN
jgi:hypothetical protein